ncbi:MAG: hypothetical protein IJL93_00025 [Bacteroidales bacterium]|nr:hypothetical protein [Bacteroidales bacterium]
MKPILKKIHYRDYLALALLGVSLFCLLFSLPYNAGSVDTEGEARRVGRQVSQRMIKLEAYMQEALNEPEESWLELVSLPEDMVIYKYVDDTLRSWCNQFSLKNDDISHRMVYPMFANPKAQYESPLTAVTAEPALICMGPKWYLVRSLVRDGTEIIGGLELVDENNRRLSNRVNRRLKLPARYAIRPLSYSGGTTVELDGRPVFKVMSESLQRDPLKHSAFIWIAYALFVAAGLLFLHNRKTLRRFVMVLPLLLAATVALYVWGRLAAYSPGSVFSPGVYADGNVLYSLGAVFVINIGIILLVMGIYFIRFELYRRIRESRNSGLWISLTGVLTILLIFGIWAYVVFTVRSIAYNSGISLEIYKLNELSLYSGLVYVFFIGLLLLMPLLIQMLRPALFRWFHVRVDAFSAPIRIFLSLVFSLTLVLVAALAGYRKEESRQAVWANRLSIDRDIVAELNLRSLERPIERDGVFAAIAGLPNSANIILNRMTENYMSRFIQDYDISVYLLNEKSATPEASEFLRRKLEGGEPVAKGSRFVYSNPAGIHAVYMGLFQYYNAYSGMTQMLVELEPKANKQDKGYSTLLGVSAPGKVLIPSNYDYAKYSDRELVTLRGNFAYPTVLNEKQEHIIYETGQSRYTDDGYLHFINRISDEDVILISRPMVKATRYVVGGVFLALVAFFMLTLLILTRRRPAATVFEKNYFRSRVSSILVLSLVITLVAMASVSVFFVYERSRENLAAMMSDKVNSIRAMLEDACRDAQGIEDLGTKEFEDALEATSNAMKADITLYGTDGKVFDSTMPEIFDRMLLGCRVNQVAFHNITHENKRFFIQRERISGKPYNALYAPIHNGEGKMLALMSSPYTEENYDLKMDAVMHFVTMLTVFLILLIIARFMTRAIVGKMFKPLELMGKKMNAADVESLEYIQYDNEDEITSLVQSYNRMVGDLTRSTKELAQAERDKAWSAMARQVAHEIKNPLTPMKLQIQRLIRLKQGNAPDWEEKFDEVSSVVLDHIDILTETANEFSTFAKLYSEEATPIDLDALIREEVSMFDNKDEIEFSYLGLEGTTVMGPKPQLTRVIVNLVANAVQAVEARRQEEAEEGKTPGPGRILVQLRQSQQDGFYDIVVEDNGRGVAEENRPKLFTPNFTTKSSGTGLGLAISRSILEKCGATIDYSTSFTLGGACFTVRYPR